MEFLYSHSKSISVEYGFFPLSSLSLFVIIVFQWSFCQSLSLFFPLLREKFLPSTVFPPSLSQEYKPTSFISSNQKWAILSSSVSSRAIDSNTVTSPFPILHNLGKQGKERLIKYVNSIWWPKMWQKNYSITQTPFKFTWTSILLSEWGLTLNPSWAALIAATYPPGPEPITVTSASTETENVWVWFFFQQNNCILRIMQVNKIGLDKEVPPHIWK